MNIIYGTAWKEDQTRELVEAALSAGFRSIDTANQRKHYLEAQVGEAARSSVVSRDELFLQTKFTFIDGQDHRLPYDPSADYQTQVEQSFSSSLEHLQTDYVDSYLLHGPKSFPDLGTADWEVWGAMESLYRQGKVRALGVSNINAWQLSQLLEKSTIQPSVVQNRCIAQLAWDVEVRGICQQEGIVYQGFWLLSGNPDFLNHPRVIQLGEKYRKTPAQILYRYFLQSGVTPLSGTTQQKHMYDALEVLQFVLQREEIEELHTASGFK